MTALWILLTMTNNKKVSNAFSMGGINVLTVY